jgi:pilus assembly protein CpaE
VLVRADRKNEVQPDFARKILGLRMLKTTVPAAFRSLEEATNTGSPKSVDNGDYRKAVTAVSREIGLVSDGESGGKGRGKGDAGVAITEFVVLIPFIGLILLLIWQAIIVGLTSMYSSHASAEGARAVAVLGYDDPGAQAEVERRAVARVSDQWGDKNHFHLSVDGDYVKVTIDAPAVLPGVHSPWGISTRAKIVYEDGGDMP